MAEKFTNARLVADIEALLEKAKSYDVETPDKLIRLDLLGSVEALHYELDDPALAMYRQLMNYTETAAVKTILQFEALKHIPRDGSISAEELASIVGADRELLTRLLRVLGATGILRSVAEDIYAHTRFSLAYIDGEEVEFFNLCVDEISPVAYRIPEYIAKHDASSIQNPRLSPFSWANDREGKGFYEILLEHPDRLARFGKAMMTHEAQDRILGIFPFTVVAKEITTDPERPFIVDVAGGRGQSLLAYKREIEKAGRTDLGKWILQEREAVLHSIPDDELPGIEKMAIDFFNPQPVKNAHIYHLRRILHNWQDNDSRKILKNIAVAMAHDSRLLIGEMVVPKKPGGVNKYVYMMDICMLVIGGKERSGREFSDLLDSVGLTLVKIWASEAGDQAIIEAKLM